MQPVPPASAPYAMPPRSRMPLFLALGALVLVAVSAVGGYLVGSAGVGHATLLINVQNKFGSTLAVQVTVNGQLVQTLTIPGGQTMTVSASVAYATANAASFDVAAASTSGPRDSSTVLVNAPGTYPVNLKLG